MAILGVNNAGAAGAMGAGRPETQAGKTVEQTFLDYMKKTPEQRFEEAWLAAHGLTKEQFDALPPDQREALTKQMAEDLKASLTQSKHADQKSKAV
jgi:hypothetical protein